jgi:hypothetical protein
MKKKLCEFFSLIVALTLLLVSCGTATETSSANSTSGNNTNSTPSTNIQDNNIATRKDVVLALFELSDKQINTQKLHPYTDVKNTDDFNPAVQWAYGLGISQDETSFRPLDPVSQPELAQFIFNFAVKVKGVSQNFYENATAYCEEIGLSILREADKTYTYTFNGWDSEVTACEGEKVYTATYKQEYIFLKIYNDYKVLNFQDIVLIHTLFHQLFVS